MNRFISLLIVALSSTAALASTQYTCVSVGGNNQATLSIGAKSANWSQQWDSADSRGTYLGKEQAQFSPWAGYSVYRLVDFFSNSDSAYQLAVSTAQNGKVKAYVYFNNDDREEEVQAFSCTQTAY